MRAPAERRKKTSGQSKSRINSSHLLSPSTANFVAGNRDWRHLRGHEVHQNRWQKLVLRKRLPPVLLLVGREGIGKEGLLGYLPGLLYCETQSACGTCSPCRGVIRGQHGEVFWLDSSRNSQDPSSEEGPGSSSGGRQALLLADAVRIQEHLLLAAGLQGRFRSVVLPDADRLNVQAANRLLKILEELPKNCFVFMSTSRIEQMLPTILSRSVKWHVTPPSRKESMELLRGALADAFGEGNPRVSDDNGHEGEVSPGKMELSESFATELLEYFSSAPGPIIKMLHSSRGSVLRSKGHGSDNVNPQDSGFQDDFLTRAQDFLGDQVAGFLKDCLLILRQPSPLRSMQLGSTWGKQLAPGQVIEGFERALNRYYRELVFQEPTKKLVDPFMIHERRGILSEARRLAIRSRILINSQLLLENLALTSHGIETYAGD